MKALFYCLLIIGTCNLAWADVQLRFTNADGDVSTMLSNGRKVRINGGPTPGYLLVDVRSGEFFVVDTERNEIVKVAPDEVGRMAEAGQLNVSLKTRGGREKVAGYTTGRYDLIANGLFCGSVYGSSKLIEYNDLRQMFKAMQGMHRLARSMVAGLGKPQSECQRAEARLADLVDISGFVMRFIDHEGKQRFDVVSLDLNVAIDPAEFELPQGMPVIDMNEKMKALGQQGQQTMQAMPDMEEMQSMMQQLQENGGQMTPEMQQQMQQMMEQMEQMQPAQ